jgi:hypothetical protein
VLVINSSARRRNGSKNYFGDGGTDHIRRKEGIIAELDSSDSGLCFRKKPLLQNDGL